MAMPIFVSSEVYREVGYPANHPLAIARIAPVMDLCEALGWLPQGYVDSPMADVATLTRFHDPAYVAALQDACTTGRVQPWMREKHGLGTLENPVFPGLFRRAALSVGGSILAADLCAAGGVAYHAPGGTHHGMARPRQRLLLFQRPGLCHPHPARSGQAGASMSISTRIMATGSRWPLRAIRGCGRSRCMKKTAGPSPGASQDRGRRHRLQPAGARAA